MKVLIVDDEPLARQRLTHLLTDFPLVKNIFSANNGLEAIASSQNNRPDIVLLDIRMPGMDGLEAAQHIMKQDNPPAIIFITAYDEYALEAFKVHAVDYLLKPVRAENLLESLTRAARLTSAQMNAINPSEKGRKNIAAKISGNIKLVPVENILYFQAEQKYVTVKHLQGETIIEDTLKDLQREFAEDFLRIHRNALVAKKFLKGLRKDNSGHTFVIIEGEDKQLEISRRHLTPVKKLLGRL